MYASRTTQLIVGIFALLGIAALAFLSLRLGKVGLFPTAGYTLYANFDNIAGLKSGDRVEIAGVQVGKVLALSLENERAHVSLRIHRGVQIDRDAIASIKTSGIIGDKYVAIAPGPSDHMLSNGQTIIHTESAFVLEDAIGALINNGTSGGGGGANKSDKSASGGNSGKSPFPSIN